MTTWQPGMRITAALLNADSSTSQTYGITAADPDWTLLDMDARRSGKLLTLTMHLDFNGKGGDGTTALSGGSVGNLPDTQIATVTDSSLFPAEDFACEATNGYGDGAGTVYADGRILLRSWPTNGTIDPGTTMLISATYVVP